MSSSANKDVKIAPGAVVCQESKLKGNITVGSMTVIHPKATLLAEAGPIIIGENNIIEEQASVIHICAQNKEPTPLTIGTNNVFEVGCEIHAKSIGDHNVFEPKCFVGPDVEIGNGCIIGAGCIITVSEKLPDQTVVTGRQCIQSIALDRPPDSDDLARQHDELTVMSEIFTKEEFSICSTGTEVHAIFQANIPLPSKFVVLLSKDSAQTDFQISHLPPICLAVYLPKDYPSHNSPGFNVSCSWLPKTKLDLLVVELTKLWEENHCEILFNWCSFLRDQSLDLLKISNSYDLSEKCLVQVGISNQSHEKNKLKDSYKHHNLFCRKPDAISTKCERNYNSHAFYKKKRDFSSQNHKENDTLTLKAKKELVKQNTEKLVAYKKEAIKQLFFHLVEYNASKAKEDFKKSMQECNICFSPVIGELCKQLSCGHITCLECLKRMCEVHIKHGTMESIVCSEDNCGFEIPANLIQELISKDLYDQYDTLMLNRTLDNITNMTYCPLVHCQYPVSTQDEDALALCPNCNHAFCIYCKRPYHGVEGCKLKSEEKQKLIEAYQCGNYEKKLELEKRYGKKQLTEMVNALQSELWLLENSKKCPCCNVNIEKNDGCNKMICRKCNTNFCWLCLTRLSSLNPYLHYQVPNSKCYNLLFEGIFNGDEIDNEDED